MKLLILDTVHPLLTEGLRQMGFQLEEDFVSPEERIMERLKGVGGIIIRSRFPVDAGFIEAAPDLRFIGRVGAGMENIDAEAARKMSVELISAPEGNRDAVGEHALGMLLMLLNNLHRADREVRTGDWRREANRGYELQGKTLGIIGYGNMGSAFAEKLYGFGTRIIAYDKYKSGFGNSKVREVSLGELKSEADVVSLHIPQTRESLGMVNDDFIESIGKAFYIINTARGRVVETAALVRGLKSGKIKGACLDVLEYEKSSFEDLFSADLPEDFRYLVESDKVVLSPHIAGWSHESNEKMARVILRKVRELKLI